MCSSSIYKNQVTKLRVRGLVGNPALASGSFKKNKQKKQLWLSGSQILCLHLNQMEILNLFSHSGNNHILCRSRQCVSEQGVFVFHLHVGQLFTVSAYTTYNTGNNIPPCLTPCFTISHDKRFADLF